MGLSTPISILLLSCSDLFPALLNGVDNFRFPEYLTILEKLGVERKGSLGYFLGALRLWTGTQDKERRSRVFDRLLHEELSKTNNQNIYPRGNKTPDLELVTSGRQKAELTGLDLLTWHGWRGGNAWGPNVYVAKQGNNELGTRETRLWTTCIGRDGNQL
jgi:hypothetical protein